MGISEDDRIRSKNRVQNEAYNLYEGLKLIGYTDEYVVKYIQLAISSCTDHFRLKVLNQILSNIRGSNEKITTD